MNQVLKISISTLLLGLMVSPNAVLAEDPEAPWREALGNDQLIQATNSRVEAAQAELDMAKSNRLPSEYSYRLF